MDNIISTEDDVETIFADGGGGQRRGQSCRSSTHGNPQINLNLVYLPLDTGDYRASLRLYYAKDNQIL